MTKLLIVLGVAMIAFGAKAMMDLKSLKDAPVRLQARVTSIQAPGMWMRLPQNGRLFLAYTYQGQEFHTGYTLVGTKPSAHKAGDSVDIVINANKPQQFIMADAFTGKSNFGLVLCIAGALLSIGAFFRG